MAADTGLPGGKVGAPPEKFIPLRALVGVATPSRPWQNPRLAARILELDGVRGLAILLVLIWHHVPTTNRFAPGSWQSVLITSTRLTWTGVDLFFVLSGFLIGGILYDAKDSINYYRAFYCRRIYRIFPIYFIWFALFGVGLLFVETHGQSALREVFHSDLPVWPYFLFLQNFASTARQALGAPWMAATWSLAVEEQFYLLLPFLVRNLTCQGIAWLAVTSILLAPVFRLILWRSGNPYFGPYTLLLSRADALAFGVLVALACREESVWGWLGSHRRHIYAILAFLGCGLVFLMKNQPSQEAAFRSGLLIGGLSWIAAFYALMLALVVAHPGRVTKACFRSPVLVKLGTVAYAVYIIHAGVYRLLYFALFGEQQSLNNWPALSVRLLSLIAVILLAAVSWRFIEKPLIRHAHRAHRYVIADEVKREPEIEWQSRSQKA